MIHPRCHSAPPEESGGGGVIQLSADAQAALKQIGARLECHDYIEAVRMFLEAQGRSLFPTDDTLIEAMTSSIGTQMTARLITAFAHFPCPSCRSGLEQCLSCAGQGIRPEGRICDSCIGSGMVRCDLCGGSGLATYSLVPLPMRYPVMGRRVHIAVRQIAMLVAAPLPDGAASLVHTVLNLNKLLTVLEDAVMASGEIQQSDPWLADSLAGLIKSCHEGAVEVQNSIRQALRKLSQAYAAGGNPNEPPGNAQRKAEYYEDLAESPSFDHTSLSHAFMPQ